MVGLVLEVVLLRGGGKSHVDGRGGGIVEGMQEVGDPWEGSRGGELFALVDGLYGEELRVGHWELCPFEENSTGLDSSQYLLML